MRMSRVSHARRRRAVAAATVITVLMLTVPAGAAGRSFGAWELAVPEPGVNTGAAEGCPIESPDGLSLCIASNRAGGTGNPDPNDIWVFQRQSIDGPWGSAENIG